MPNFAVGEFVTRMRTPKEKDMPAVDPCSTLYETSPLMAQAKNDVSVVYPVEALLARDDHDDHRQPCLR